MQENKSDTQKQEKNRWDIIPAITRKSASLLTALYAITMVSVLPFYFEAGYDHIGTDKAMFFRKAGIPLLVAALAVSLLYAAILYISGYKNESEETLWNVIKREMSVTDWCAAGYTAVLLLSYMCTDYPTTAVWGEPGWYMGLVPQLALTASYFLISRMLRKGQWLFYPILTVSFVVFLLGLLNRYNIYPMAMSSANPGFISTIGNINWYCGYWAVVSFAGMAVLWGRSYSVRHVAASSAPHSGETRCSNMVILALAGIYCALSLATGITQGSDSGLVALAAVLFVMFVLSLRNGVMMQRYMAILLLLFGTGQIVWIVHKAVPEANNLMSEVYLWLMNTPAMWIGGVLCLLSYIFLRAANPHNAYPKELGKKLQIIIMVLFAAGIALYIFLLVINTLYPGSVGGLSANSLFIFNDAWGSNRGATWRAGFLTWQNQDILHKLIGTGPDGMACYLYSGQKEEISVWLNTVFGSLRLTNAHGEWITILANLGVLGVISFGGMIISAIIRCIKAGRYTIWAYACGFCLLAYTFHNIFSFQQTINVTQMFIILGIGEGILRRRKSDKPSSGRM